MRGSVSIDTRTPDPAGGEDIGAAMPERIECVDDRSLLIADHPHFLERLFNEAPFADDLFKKNGVGHARLTRRELEVLAAMADSASNKAIARRLGISFHTAKFHVAAILAKLDADSRTEAVAKAAQLGLVML